MVRNKSSHEGLRPFSCLEKWMWYLAIKSAWWKSRFVVSFTRPIVRQRGEFFVKKARAVFHPVANFTAPKGFNERTFFGLSIFYSVFAEKGMRLTKRGHGHPRPPLPNPSSFSLCWLQDWRVVGGNVMVTRPFGLYLVTRRKLFI